MTSILLDLLNEQYSKDNVAKILEGYAQKRYTTLRINTLKTSIQEVKNVLENNNIPVISVPWYSKAFILKENNEEDIKKLDIYQNGDVYLQSLSSMLPVLILNPYEKQDILDMCAAPGSKTTQMAIETNNKAYITACEKNKIRLERLKYNLEKQGVTCCNCLNENALDLDSMFSFDTILLDAPCSGSGTINIEEIKKDIFSKERLKKITDRQEALLKKALKLVKPGGLVVYSTCSILKNENEMVLNKVQKQIALEIIPINISKEIETLPVDIPGTVCLAPNEYFERKKVIKVLRFRYVFYLF